MTRKEARGRAARAERPAEDPAPRYVVLTPKGETLGSDYVMRSVLLAGIK